MFSVLTCFSTVLILYSSTADGNPRVIDDMEALFPKEKPTLRQPPQQNYWYTPRLGKRVNEELGFEYDQDDPVGINVGKRMRNSVFIPRTGKREDLLFLGRTPSRSHAPSDGQNWEKWIPPQPQIPDVGLN